MIHNCIGSSVEQPASKSTYPTDQWVATLQNLGQWTPEWRQGKSQPTRLWQEREMTTITLEGSWCPGRQVYVVEVSRSRVLSYVIKSVAAHSSQTMLRIIWRKSAIERSETWRSAVELAASGGDGLAAWSVASGRLATTWLSAGGGGGQVRCCLVLLTTTTHYTTSARTATTGANTASSSGHGNGS